MEEEDDDDDLQLISLMKIYIGMEQVKSLIS